MTFNTAKVVVLLNVVRLCIFVRLDRACGGRSPADPSLLLLDLAEEVSNGTALRRIVKDLTVDFLHEGVSHPLMEWFPETVIRIEGDA